MRGWARGDIDGFFGLAIDNLVQLLLIDSLCRYVLRFPSELITFTILPGAGVSLIVGNLFYAWQARRLMQQTGRSDVCALPYGINTVSLIAHVFLVMLPARAIAEAAGYSDADAARYAWKAGLAATLGSGLIEFGGAFIAQTLRRVTPRAALLSTLAGIAIGFIAMTFFFRTFAHPLIGLVTLGIVFLTYFGRVRFKGGLPGGLVAVLVGTAIAWGMGLAPVNSVTPSAPQWAPPLWVVGDLWEAIRQGLLIQYLPVIIPMGLFNLLGSLQNIESADAAGDSYPTRPSLMVNGIGTFAAVSFGSCFPTTIYIGHPGWKMMGARAGYSVLNAIFFTVICLSGLLPTIAWALPVEVGMAIVIYIGIVIGAQAFQATPREHAPAVIVGILPALAAWGTLLTKTTLKTTGYGTPDRSFADSEQLTPKFEQFDYWIHGAYALSEGFIFVCMILSALTVAIIDRRFRVGAVWCFVGAILAASGLMHSYQYTPTDTALAFLQPAWQHVYGYLAMGALLWIAPWITVPQTSTPQKDS